MAVVWPATTRSDRAFSGPALAAVPKLLAEVEMVTGTAVSTTVQIKVPVIVGVEVTVLEGLGVKVIVGVPVRVGVGVIVKVAVAVGVGVKDPGSVLALLRMMFTALTVPTVKEPSWVTGSPA